MIKVKELNCPSRTCWIRACINSGLSDLVPITTPYISPSIHEIATFCKEKNVPNNFQHHRDESYYYSKYYWPAWEVVPWNNIVIVIDLFKGGHAESVHSKAQYDELKKQYPECYGFIDVGEFGVECYKTKSRSSK